MFTVTYSKAHEIERTVGEFGDFEAAEAAARKAGAVGEGQKAGNNRNDRIYDVAGHEGDDNYAIWIEED